MAGSSALFAGLSGCLLASPRPSHEVSIKGTPLGDDISSAFASDESSWSSAQRQAVTELLTDGQAVRTAPEADELFDDGEYVHADGTYYRITRSLDGEKTVERPVLRAEAVDESAVEGDVVSLDEFIGAERRAVQHVVVSAIRGRPEPYVLHTDPEETPALQPELRYRYIEHSAGYYRLSQSVEAVIIDQVVFSVDEVAADVSAFETVITESERLIHIIPDELAAAERDIMEETLGTDGYFGTAPFSESEEAVFALLEVEIRSTGSQKRAVEYGDSYYYVEIGWSHGD